MFLSYQTIYSSSWDEFKVREIVKSNLVDEDFDCLVSFLREVCADLDFVLAMSPMPLGKDAAVGRANAPVSF